MGKKQHKKPANNVQNKESKRLSPQKRAELAELCESLQKIGFKQANTLNEQWSQFVEIQGHLDRILAIEGPKPKGLSKNRRANIDAFYKWLNESGAFYDGVKISEFPGYDFGLEATKDIKKDDTFIKVPGNIIMSDGSMASVESVILSAIPMFDAMTNIKLAFTLLLERVNPNSFWKPYIDMLPDRYPTVLYFSVSEMQELKGSNVLSQALNQCKCIARQYAFIYTCLQKMKHSSGDTSINILKEKFSYELYRWAVSTVMTRQNAIPRLKQTRDSDQTTIAALIPLWDICNHKDGIVTSAFNTEENQLESWALENFAKGEQIFMYYGDRSNGDLLVHNGFIYANNKNDYVNIKLGLSNSDELLAERTKLLEMLKLQKNCEVKILPPPQFISSQLLAFVRVFNMNKDQLEHWISSDRAADLLHIDCALETSLELKSWTFMQNRLTLLLRLFPTTLEEDEAALVAHQKGHPKLGHVKAMLLQYRILEKYMLSNALDYAKLRTKV